MANQREYDRDRLLTEVAQLYYGEDRTQNEIAKVLGFDRTTVSRMLLEAKAKGIVSITIKRPLHFDEQLGAKMVATFGLTRADIVVTHDDTYEHVLQRVGEGGAVAFRRFVRPGVVLGITLGTTLSAIVNSLPAETVPNVRVVQLAGAVGASGPAYDSAVLVRRLSELLGATPYYLSAPLLVDSEQTAKLLLEHPNNKPTIAAGRSCDAILVGIGRTDARASTLYLGGHISLAELETLQANGAVGDALGHPFDVSGNAAGESFSRRLVNITRRELLGTPVRLGVAAGPAKALPLLGALRGGYLNNLVTDTATAHEVLRLHAGTEGSP